MRICSPRGCCSDGVSRCHAGQNRLRRSPSQRNVCGADATVFSLTSSARRRPDSVSSTSRLPRLCASSVLPLSRFQATTLFSDRDVDYLNAAVRATGARHSPALPKRTCQASRPKASFRRSCPATHASVGPRLASLDIPAFKRPVAVPSRCSIRRIFSPHAACSKRVAARV